MGNFGAIVFAPLGGYLIDATSEDPSRPNFSASVYIYLALKVVIQLCLDKRRIRPKILTPRAVRLSEFSAINCNINDMLASMSKSVRYFAHSAIC